MLLSTYMVNFHANEKGMFISLYVQKFLLVI